MILHGRGTCPATSHERLNISEPLRPHNGRNDASPHWAAGRTLEPPGQAPAAWNWGGGCVGGWRQSPHRSFQSLHKHKFRVRIPVRHLSKGLPSGLGLTTCRGRPASHGGPPGCSVTARRAPADPPPTTQDCWRHPVPLAARICPPAFPPELPLPPCPHSLTLSQR